ncbi:MAG TPA: MarR family transcriptional regulator [Acidimicrobiales bacterium]|nr:MarR family transcriptional regulator [Acidimicrobiales bacterium]
MITETVATVPTDVPTAPRDRVDALVAYWREENPALDVATKSLAIRLKRAAHHLAGAFRADLAGLDMETWEAEVLLGLRQSPGRRTSAGTLGRDAQVTSGAMTNRLARLERRGWVRRDVDPHDRRHVLVSLTADGLCAADRLIAAKTVAEERLFAAVDRDTRERLAADLRTLLLAIEGPVTSESDLRA